MKPMAMRMAAPCCGTFTLLWNVEKGCFLCPCGKMRVGLDGREQKRFGTSQAGGRKGGLAKAANRRK